MRALIADDDELLRTMLEDLLAKLGHEVKSAGNGAELVRLALAERPDLVITDLHMPEMSGNSMLAMLGRFPDLSGIPVILITGAARDEFADMGIPEEIPVLFKPFNFAKLSAEIRKIKRRQCPADS
ncbi:MAG: response regulator [Elusimicrobia bacterium]|nr:response regulator [Elusimicrobiota bacterium]